MKLKKLLQKVPLELFRGSKEVEITGLSAHSKRVAPGNLFIARSGTEHDGANYLEEAVQNGAIATLARYPDPFLKEVVQLLHPDVGAIEGQLASAYYEEPSKELFSVAITGTCGKTTTAYLIRHLLERAGVATGLLGSIEYLVGGMRYPAERTTPDVTSVHRYLREMCKQQCQAVVLEATSHALTQGRLAHIDFDVAVFTNLNQDHLDYHGTMEAYGSAKARLFSGLLPNKAAVINGDDPFGRGLLALCPPSTLTYGMSEGVDLRVKEFQLGVKETRFSVVFKGEELLFTTKLLGRFNILNCLAALGTLLQKGVAFGELPALLASFSSVPGRLQRVRNRAVFVDHAHKPGALESVLKTLRELTKGKLILVFGCGGDRDRGKRALMGAIGERLCDLVFVTSDNPRSEEPLAIIREIMEGVRGDHVQVEADRRVAIEKALRSCGKEDIVLIAGKGHEKVQIFAHQTLPFDDVKVAEQLMDQLS